MSTFDEDLTLGELSVIVVMILGVFVLAYLSFINFFKIAIFYGSMIFHLIPIIFFTKRLKAKPIRIWLTLIIIFLVLVNFFLFSLAVNTTSLTPYFWYIFSIQLFFALALGGVAFV